MGVMRVMTAQAGDEPDTWNPDDPESVQAAETRFNEMIGKGHKAYAVERKPQRAGSPISKFDPALGEIIFAAPMAGG